MPNMMEFSDDEKKQIKEQAINFWRASTDWCATYYTLVNEFERLATCKLPSELEDAYAALPDRSCFVPPDIYNSIVSLRAAIHRMLFKRKPYFNLSLAGKPYVINEIVDKANIVLQSMLDMMYDGAGFPSEADKAIYQSLYSGMSASFLEWHIETVRNPIRLSKDAYPLMGQFEDKVIAMYPRPVSLDIRRTRIDPSAASRSEIRIVGYQSVKMQSELKIKNRDQRTPYGFDETELEKTSFSPHEYFQYMPEKGSYAPDIAQSSQSFGDKLVEIWSIRGLFRFKQPDGTVYLRDIICEIGNQNILLAAKVNDLPIPSWQMFDYPAVDAIHGRLFTPGIIEPAQDLFVYMFVNRNLAVDSAQRNVFANYVGDAAACQNLPDYIRSAGDQLYKIDLGASGLPNVGAAIQPLMRPPLGNDPFQQSMVMKKEIQQTMRLSDYLMGTTPDRSETATGVQSIVSGGQNLTEFMVEKLADTYFRPLMRKMMIMWNFFNGNQQQQVTGYNGQNFTILPGELDFPFHCSIETNVEMTRPDMVRRYVEVFPVLKDDPMYDKLEVRRTFNDIMNFPNKDRLLVDMGLLQMQIDKENLALFQDIPQPTHPLENHIAHWKGHGQYMQQVMRDKPTEEITKHMMEHQQHIEQSQNALGNTKEMGGNAGNMVQPDSAAMKNRQQNAPTGQYMARERR